MFKMDLEKAEESEIKLPTYAGSQKNQENSISCLRIYFCFIDYSKAFVQITTNCGKFFKRWEYQITWSASWETCVQIRKEQLELDMKQQIGSKLGKEYVKALYCHPDYLTYMKSTSCKMPGWMKHKLESRLQGEICWNQDCREKYQ